jgi:hypothetical protein
MGSSLDVLGSQQIKQISLQSMMKLVLVLSGLSHFSSVTDCQSGGQLSW